MTDTIISVQDIRTKLGTISRRAEDGESFTVVRNSKPAFRIVPLDTSPYAVEPSEKLTLREIRERFKAVPAAGMITPEELTEIIREVHAEINAARQAGQPHD